MIIAREDPPDPVTLGRFRPLEFLGKGGFGSVWRVEDPYRPDSTFALKLLHSPTPRPGAAGRDGGVQRELEIGVRIRHPVLVEVVESGSVEVGPGRDPAPYLLSEFVHGQPLAPSWTPEELSPIAADLLSALASVHAAGWRHGDIQPANILVERGAPSRVRLLDFGLSQRLDRAARGPARGGHPRYISPEALIGEIPDHRSDLFSLGLVLLECLTRAFDDELGEHLRRIRDGAFADEARGAASGHPLDAVLCGLLAADPLRRWQSASEAFRALEAGPGRNARPSTVPTFETASPVGRDEALRALGDAVESISGGSSRLAVIAIEGEAGLGKTRLLAEALDLALRNGLRAWDWVVAREAARRGPSGSRGEHGPQGSDWSHAVTSTTSREDRVDRLAERLLGVVGESPTLVALDGVDRAAEVDRQILRAVIEKAYSRLGRSSRDRRTRFPILVLSANPKGLSSRPEAAAIWRRILALPYTRRFDLLAWTNEESSEYLDGVLRPARSLGAAEAVLEREASGNPGRWRRILRELFRRKALRIRDGSWVLEGDEASTAMSIPGDREGFLTSWTALSSTARDLLVVTALWSDPDACAPPEVLGRVLDLAADSVREGLMEIEDIDGLSAPVGRPGADPVAPRLNARERAWVLRRAGRERREALRRALADCELVPPLEGLLQRIHLEPVRLDRVLEETETAPAEEARRRVLREYLGSRHVGPGERCVAALRLGESLRLSGRSELAGRYLLLATRSPDREHSLHANLSLAELRSAAGRDDADGCFERAEELLREGDPVFPRYLFARAVHALRHGDERVATSFVDRALERLPGHPAFYNLRGNISLRLGRLLEAKGDFDAARRLARKALAAQAADAAVNSARALLRLGREREAVRSIREAVAGFEKAGMRSQVALARGNLGVVLRRSGDFEASLRELELSLTLYRELGDRVGQSVILANLGQLSRQLGLPGSASRHLRAARELARGASEDALRRLEAQPAFRVNEALLALDLGRLEDASVLADELAPLQTAAGSPSDPERLLLEARLARRGETRRLDALREFLEREERSRGPDGEWLYELVRAVEPSGGDAAEIPAPLQLRAREQLESLAASSTRARFLLDLALAESLPGDATAARETVLAGWRSFPLRALKQRALRFLVRTADDPRERNELVEHLKVSIEEVVLDLEPQQRERFRDRPDIREAWTMIRRSSVDEASPAPTSRVLHRILQFNREILQERDVDRILVKIVDAAMALTNAERGVLALRGRRGLEYAAARGLEGVDLDDPDSQISRTILERALTEGVSKVTTDASEDVTLRSISSVEDLGLRSVICVPLRGKRKAPLGALYLDNSLEKGIFGPEELELVESFCSQAALAWLAAESRKERERLLAELSDARDRLRDDLEASRREAVRRRAEDRSEFCGIVGRSRPTRELFRWIEAVGPTDISILVTGESGVGKELVVRAIHHRSHRRDGPFIAENCGAVPAGLLESILFGHEKGAFTGADRRRRGLFELAQGGTLFLDEVAELPLELQARLLRVLQEGELRPIGSQRVIKLDVRVIAATNRVVRRAVEKGDFREDLYYRLHGAEIAVPSLRERAEDIPALAEHFLERIAGDAGPPKRMSARALECLTRYPWPGNVRELENEIRRSAALCGSAVIGVEYLSPEVREGRPTVVGVESAHAVTVRPLRVVERDTIVAAMAQFAGHRGKAAEALGISRSTLYHKLREIGFEKGRAGRTRVSGG